MHGLCPPSICYRRWRKSHQCPRSHISMFKLPRTRRKSHQMCPLLGIRCRSLTYVGSHHHDACSSSDADPRSGRSPKYEPWIDPSIDPYLPCPWRSDVARKGCMHVHVLPRFTCVCAAPAASLASTNPSMKESTKGGGRHPLWRRREAPPPSWMGLWRPRRQQAQHKHT